MANANAPDRPVPKGESPQTVSPIEFEDENQETGIVMSDNTEQTTQTSAPPTAAQRAVRFEEQGEDTPPPAKPPRPMSPQAQAEATLIEAFPSIDAKVVKAVLVASGGQVEPAFNALLSMSDPNFKEETPPPQPPRPTAEQRQMQQDEMYARQLAEHYGSAERGYGPRTSSLRQPRGAAAPPPPPDREHSFLDDDLPEIRENLRQGFLQTQTKVNKWISDIHKKFQGEEEEDDLYSAADDGQPTRQNFGPSQSDQLYGIQRTRQSTDRARYDADPRELSGNFTELELRDDEDVPPPKPARPLANPDLFKPTPTAPPPPQSGPVDEVDALYKQPVPPSNRQPSPSAGGRSKKWQPLTSVAPRAEAEDNDPFSLGDSEDEKDAKTKDIRAEDTARLKRSASNAQEEPAAPLAEGQELTLEPAEQSGSQGTRNKEAEELLK